MGKGALSKMSVFLGISTPVVWGTHAVFLGKRHDNILLNVPILLSRNFVVISQASILVV